MAHILIIYNAKHSEAVRLAHETAHWLQHESQTVSLVDQQTALQWERLSSDDIQLVVTLGGDGTLLTGAFLSAPMGVPLLGVHLGRFGFIAQVEPEELRTALERWQAGEFHLQERLMVQAQIGDSGRVVYALNEIALVRHSLAPMLNFTIHLNDLMLTTYPADGSLVSTPTGSTAYALSVGAPVVHPQAEVLILSPISPHTLGARPLVLPSTTQIAITVECKATDGQGEALMSADGRKHQSVALGQTVFITAAPFRTRLLAFHEGEFFEKLRDRLLWGARVNA
ncbi:MAG: NAD(+) kinase [Armatimonadota bacterium]